MSVRISVLALVVLFFYIGCGLVVDLKKADDDQGVGSISPDSEKYKPIGPYDGTWETTCERLAPNFYMFMRTEYLGETCKGKVLFSKNSDCSNPFTTTQNECTFKIVGDAVGLENTKMVDYVWSKPD